ncbi:transglycosylase SLT domain-containing protein [Streptomyces niger]|uniref:transglycosylase SLT domain-containing protein n=1 Tax=Streptomyces niger TaxID=66373 RepID=UPI0018FE6409|nr:transglycosylase SLT domain-containing protein [Streptomyces niger]
MTAPENVATRVVQECLVSEFPDAGYGAEYGKFWGPGTRKVYGRWQRGLGLSGADADGVPGKFSLTELAKKHGMEIRGRFAEDCVDPIHTGQIDFSGRGAWPAGRAACEKHIRKALDIMGLPERYWLPGLLTIASRESAYNASKHQINTHDDNARNVPDLFGGRNAPDGFKGMCSRGMLQTVPQTFARFHATGTSRKIYDPVSSAAAANNYIMSRYKVARDGHDLAAKVRQADPNRRGGGY